MLWGACDALFTPRPLAPLHDIARQTRASCSPPSMPRPSRDAIFSAALDELEHGPPALLVFEDCHWADEATFDLLKFLGRRMQRTRSMLVMTYRTDEVGSRHPCRFVIGDLPCSIVRRLPLQPLSRSRGREAGEAGGTLLAGAVQHDRRQSVLRHRSARDRRRVDPVERARRRARARSQSCRRARARIAELVSIVPGKAEAWLLEQAGVHDEAGIESCLGIGMVRDESGSLAFRHDLARRALEDSLSQAQQQSLHAKVLAILGTRPGIRRRGSHTTPMVRGTRSKCCVSLRRPRRMPALSARIARRCRTTWRRCAMRTTFRRPSAHSCSNSCRTSAI